MNEKIFKFGVNWQNGQRKFDQTGLCCCVVVTKTDTAQFWLAIGSGLCKLALASLENSLSWFQFIPNFYGNSSDLVGNIHVAFGRSFLLE